MHTDYFMNSLIFVVAGISSDERLRGWSHPPPAKKRSYSAIEKVDETIMFSINAPNIFPATPNLVWIAKNLAFDTFSIISFSFRKAFSTFVARSGGNVTTSHTGVVKRQETGEDPLKSQDWG